MVDSQQSQRVLSLVCPGLIPDSKLESKQNSGLNPLQHPNIEKFLSRAKLKASAHNNLESLCFSLSGYPDSENVPSGALTHYATSGVKDDEYWMLATPAHMEADQSNLLLMDCGEELSLDQATPLQNHLNAHFLGLGIEFELISPMQWLLKVDSLPPTNLRSYREAVGKPMDAGMLDSDEDNQWWVLLNEIQMSLFEHPINQQREQQGQLSVNTLWAWGAGKLPLEIRQRVKYVYADTLFNQGLAQLNHSKIASVADFSKDLKAGEVSANCVVVISSLLQSVDHGSVDQWNAELQEIDQNLIPMAINALKERLFDSVILYSLNGKCFELKRNYLNKIWRLRKSLSAWR